MRTIVCDAGPIIHLYEANCLQLLRQTGNLYLPRRVFHEVQTTIHLKEPWPEWLQVISLSSHELREAGVWKRSGDLHDGEAEALVLARRKKADWFLTDDSTTRLFVSRIPSCYEYSISNYLRHIPSIQGPVAVCRDRHGSSAGIGSV